MLYLQYDLIIHLIFPIHIHIFLGFLNANPAPHIRARVANYGLMDQMAALHWIQQNIEKFGGNPSMITLAGHGTGAACIDFLMSSPSMGKILKYFIAFNGINCVNFSYLFSPRIISSCHSYVWLSIFIMGISRRSSDICNEIS